jgi:hypothetical protein
MNSTIPADILETLTLPSLDLVSLNRRLSAYHITKVAGEWFCS